MSEKVFSCSCLNVRIRCTSKGTFRNCTDEKLKNAFANERLLILENPQKQVTHDWLLRSERIDNTIEVKHCTACNSNVFAVQAPFLIVPEKLQRTNASLEALRKHECYSECFQIIVDPKRTLVDGCQRDHSSVSDAKDSLVPGHLEGIRLKMVQVVKQIITAKQQAIDEEHRKAMEKLRAFQTKCDVQCNRLLTVIEYQESAAQRRFSEAHRSCSMIERSESLESETSARSGEKEPIFDDDVFEMQLNDETFYGDRTIIEKADEAADLSPSDDEGVSTSSQDRTRKSSTDLTQYASSVPINIPRRKDFDNWQGLRPGEQSRLMREQSPAKPSCEDDIARSMRDISNRLNDDHTKTFGALPRPRLYTNHF